MSMHVVFIKDFEGRKEGDSDFLEVTLARRLCERSIAVPFSEYTVAVKPKKDVPCAVESKPVFENDVEGDVNGIKEEPKKRGPKNRKYKKLEKAALII